MNNNGHWAGSRLQRSRVQIFHNLPACSPECSHKTQYPHRPHPISSLDLAPCLRRNIRILNMRSTTVASTLFLLASAVAAQQSDSVVTEIPSSLVQTTEQVYTIQTSDPAGTGSVCYEVCIQEPCNACAQHHGSLITSS